MENNKIKWTDVMKAMEQNIKIPKTEEEAIEHLKQSNTAKSGLETQANISALIHILINKGICTEEEYKQIKQAYLDVLYKATAKELLNQIQKAQEEE